MHRRCDCAINDHHALHMSVAQRTYRSIGAPAQRKIGTIYLFVCRRCTQAMVSDTVFVVKPINHLGERKNDS